MAAVSVETLGLEKCIKQPVQIVEHNVKCLLSLQPASPCTANPVTVSTKSSNAFEKAVRAILSYFSLFFYFFPFTTFLKFLQQKNTMPVYYLGLNLPRNWKHTYFNTVGDRVVAFAEGGSSPVAMTMHPTYKNDLPPTAREIPMPPTEFDALFATSVKTRPDRDEIDRILRLYAAEEHRQELHAP